MALNLWLECQVIFGPYELSHALRRLMHWICSWIPWLGNNLLISHCVKVGLASRQNSFQFLIAIFLILKLLQISCRWSTGFAFKNYVLVMWCLLVFPGSRCVFASEWLVGLDQILLSTSQMARFCTRLLLNLNLLLICHMKRATSSQMIILLEICSRFVLWCLRCLLKLRRHLAGYWILVRYVTKRLEICNIGTINLDIPHFLLFSVVCPVLFLRMHNSAPGWICSLCFWSLCVERVIVGCASLLPWLVCSITLSENASMWLLSESLYEHALRIIFSYFFTFHRKISRCGQFTFLSHIIHLLLEIHQLLPEAWVRINKIAPLPHNS